jgi:hypothetical protein
MTEPVLHQTLGGGSRLRSLPELLHARRGTPCHEHPSLDCNGHVLDELVTD